MPPPYVPKPQRRFEFGVRPGRGDSPLRQEPDDDAWVQHRRRVLDVHRDQCVALPSSRRDAFDEAAVALSGWTKSSIATATDDFETIASHLAEDVVVLVPDEDSFVVAGGLLALPSGWSINEKLGRSIAATHQSVPGFADHLQAKTDRMLHALRPGKYVERHNLIFNPSSLWTLLPERWDELDRVRKNLTVNEVGSTIHLRTEYQTFARCGSGSTRLFLIRIYQTPIHQLSQGERTALLETIQAWSPEIRTYKRITLMEDALVEYLRG